jgi:hypothetical protein
MVFIGVLMVLSGLRGRAQSVGSPTQYLAGFAHMAFSVFSAAGQPVEYWQSEFKLSNTSSVPALVTLHHFGNDGKPYALSLGGNRSTDHSYTIPANGSIDVSTDLTREATTEGWTACEFTSAGVHGQLIFKLHHGDGTETEATVPMTTRLQGQAIIALPSGTRYVSITPFDNTNGNATGVAMANTANAPITLHAQMLDQNGQDLGEIVNALPAFGHVGIVLPSAYTQTVGKQGTIRVKTPGVITVGILLDSTQTRFTTLLTDSY